MPLRLKSLELHGYKTFAAKSNFEFAEGITAIVGPNGSGKSNIADALRWVLGEQSYSLLRAKRTEDMIFAGSEQRPRAGMASASVIFDNSNNWLPVDFSEVGLSRRAYRDGRNEYLLNGQHVRLRDINELLAQSGLSERTYTILGQGLVDASLALKADERRKLFEEAAGIGLYRARREEALRRLDTTKRNLDRVLDILAELEPRLKSLERQATRAQEYSQVQSDLRVLLREWYGYHWHQTQNNLAIALDALRNQEARLLEARETYQAVRESFALFRDRLNGMRGKLNSWHRESALLHANREAVSNELAVLEERQRSLNENKQGILGDKSRLSDEIRIGEERLKAIEDEKTRLQAEKDDVDCQLSKVQDALGESQLERAHHEKNLLIARERENNLASTRLNLQARIDDLAVRSESIGQKLSSLVDEISIVEEDLQQEENRCQLLGIEQKQAETRVHEKQEDLSHAQRQVQELERENREKQTLKMQIQGEGASLRAQLEVIDQAEQSLSGYAEGAKVLLDAARQSMFAGGKTALASILDVPVELEAAISAALGEYADSVLINSWDEIDVALSLLEKDDSGRASILPLDILQPDISLVAGNGSGILGIAADLVKCPVELKPAVDLLLGQVFLVSDRKYVRNILAGQPRTARAVTLKGEVFHASGQIQAGKPAKVNILSRSRQRREYQAAIIQNENRLKQVSLEIAKINGREETARTNVVDCDDQLSKERLKLETARKEFQLSQVRLDSLHRKADWHQKQRIDLEAEGALSAKEKQLALEAIAEKSIELDEAHNEVVKEIIALGQIVLDELQEQVTHWSSRKAALEQAVANVVLQLSERKEAINRIHLRLADADLKLSEVDKNLSQIDSERKELHEKSSSFNEKLGQLRMLIDPAEKELEQIENQESRLQKQETEDQASLARIERYYNQLQMDVSRKQEALETLRSKIEDDFGLVMFEYANEVSGPVPLPLDGMVEQLPVVIELAPDLEENLTRQRAFLRRMGAINPEAKQEFQSVKERYTFLTDQMNDLHKAEADLHQVIAELDELTHREFQKTFDEVAEQFHTIFHRLFGGGSARLVLTDPEDLSLTGIDIEARLPGRREQGLSLLSGGERSLTAIALVFALLKVSPTPVCVMDEVDAMLDEANVGRFRDLLAELSKDTQFVIITHNRNTVQAADVIYGVTMGRDSTSQVISLKLDEVSEEYLK